jgi:hypothetical protein
VAGHGRAEDQRTLEASGYDPHTDRRQRGGACHGSALAKRFDAQHRAKVFPRGGRRRGRVHLPKAWCIGCQRLKRPPADGAVSGRRAARQERRRGGQKGVKGPCTVSRGKNVSPEGEEARRAGTVSRGKNVQIGEHRGDADVDGKAAAVRGDAEARGARARGGVREPPLLVLGLEDRARGGLGVGAARRCWGVRRAACGVRRAGDLEERAADDGDDHLARLHLAPRRLACGMPGAGSARRRGGCGKWRRRARRRVSGAEEGTSCPGPLARLFARQVLLLELVVLPQPAARRVSAAPPRQRPRRR